MRRLAGIEHARRTAARLIDEFGVSRPEHIDIEGFAARIGINIVMGDLDGANAQLVVTPTNVYILVASRVTDAAVRRFSIAHELGHFVLDHPARPAAELCTPSPVPRDDSTHRDHECEANAFAAELLMPTALMARHALTAPVGMDVVWHIATTFRVSCLAAAIELVRHSREPCAAVFSKRGVVRWAAISAVFPFEIERGTKVGHGTEAAAFYTTGKIAERARSIPVTEWCRALDDNSFEGRATRAFAAYLADTQRDQPTGKRSPDLRAMRAHPAKQIGGRPGNRSGAGRSVVVTSIRAFDTRVYLPIEIEEHAVASREFDTVLSMLWVPPAAQAVLARDEAHARPLLDHEVRPLVDEARPLARRDGRHVGDHEVRPARGDEARPLEGGGGRHVGDHQVRPARGHEARPLTGRDPRPLGDRDTRSLGDRDPRPLGDHDARPLGDSAVRPPEDHVVRPTSEHGPRHESDIRAIPEHVFGATREHLRTTRRKRGAIPTIPETGLRFASNDSVVGHAGSLVGRSDSPVGRIDSHTRHDSLAVRDDSLVSRIDSLAVHDDSLVGRIDSLAVRDDSLVDRIDSRAVHDDSLVCRIDSLVAHDGSHVDPMDPLIGRDDSLVGCNDSHARNDSRPVRGPRDDSRSVHESTAILDDNSNTRTREHTRGMR